MTKKSTTFNGLYFKIKPFALLLVSLFALKASAQTQIIFDPIPEDATISCDQDVPELPQVNASSDCLGEVTIQFSTSEQSGECLNSYNIIRTWMASDNCGNAEILTQTVVVQDILPPVFVDFPANVTVTCNQMPDIANPTAIDNCTGEVTVTYLGNENSLDDCTQTVQRSWSATDACGNTTIATQTITKIDTISPVLVMGETSAEISCTDLDLAAALDGNLDEVRALFMSLGLVPIGVTDNCCITSWSEVGVEITEGNCPILASFTCSFVAVDHCQNYSDTISSIITVVDNAAPIITCPGNIEITCGDPIPEPLVGVEASDDCSDATIFLFSEIISGSGCNTEYTRTYRAIDACGNFSECTQIITLFDEGAPVIIACPSDVSVECGETLPEVGSGVEASSECGGIVISLLTQVISGSICNLEYARTYRATDACGNFADCTQIISVNDNTPPVIDGNPESGTFECANVPSEEQFFATDNCDTEVPVVFTQVYTQEGECAVFSIVRKWTATDDCGNVAELVQTINIIDNTPPEIECPGDLELECTTEIPEPLDGVFASDACTNATIALLSEIISGTGCNKTYVRTYRATDECGNFSDCTQNISTIDATDPVIDGDPEDITVECSDIPEPGIYTATDNCDENVIVVFSASILDGECENDYTILRRWIATDDCGNAATISQSVTVFDNTAPVIECPANLELECTSDVPVPLEGVVASDNCSDVSLFLFSEIISGSGCDLAFIRTYRAYDACNNFSECTQTITTNDDTPPVINGDPEDLTVSCDSVPEPISFTATDNCTDSVVVSFSESILDGDCESGYLILRRWIATDDCGNSITVSQGINVGGGPGLSPLGENTIRLTAAPNPTKGITNFKFMLTYNSHVTLNMTTPQGNELAQVYNGKVNEGQEMTASFNSQPLAAGIYFYQLITDKEVRVGRLVVNK
jgi:large repetitive protein